MKFTINNFFSTIILFIFICGTTTIVSGQSTAVSSLQLIVDFTSTVSYIDNECGGALLSNDLTVYPPCKNFKDTGDRARQYLGQSPSVLIPDNNILIVSVVNSALSPIISGQSTQLGNLYGFCTIDISISTGDTRIVLDGSLATDSFLTYREPNTPYTNFQCSGATYSRMVKVKYMKFINWEQQTIFNVNVDQVLNPMKTGISLQNLMVENATSVINVQPKSSSYEYGSLVVNFGSSQFTGISSPVNSLAAPFNFVGSTSNLLGVSVSDSIIGTTPLFYQERGYLRVGTNKFNKVEINSSQSLIKTVNVGKNCVVEFNVIGNSTLSSFYHGSASIVSQAYISDFNLFQNTFSGNTITNSANGVSNGFVFNQRYQGETYIFQSTSLNFDQNVFLTNKPIFDIENSQLSILNTYFPPSVVAINSQNSSSSFSGSIISSNIPIVGNNSYIYFEPNTALNLPNLVYCQICSVQVGGQVVYNTFV